MPTLKQCAVKLEKKNILHPTMVMRGEYKIDPFSIDDDGVEEVVSSVPFQQVATMAEEDATIAAWLNELCAAQKPELWNVFVRNNGVLTFPEADYSGTIPLDDRSSAYWSTVTRSRSDGSVNVSMGLNYSTALRLDGLIEHELFHELGHMIDDQTFLVNKRMTAMGFHSTSTIWQWLADLDRETLPMGGITQIEANRREARYLSTSYKWDGELFAEAVNWYMGPKIATALYQGPDHTLAQKAVYSPLIQAYMDTAVAMDIAIQSQDKPYAACQEDRKKLQAVLNLPPEQFFDLDTVNELEDRIHGAPTRAIKMAATDTLTKHIEAGLQKMTAAVAAEIGIPAPAINSRQK